MVLADGSDGGIGVFEHVGSVLLRLRGIGADGVMEPFAVAALLVAVCVIGAGAGRFRRRPEPNRAVGRLVETTPIHAPGQIVMNDTLPGCAVEPGAGRDVFVAAGDPYISSARSQQRGGRINQPVLHSVAGPFGCIMNDHPAVEVEEPLRACWAFPLEVECLIGGPTGRLVIKAQHLGVLPGDPQCAVHALEKNRARIWDGRLGRFIRPPMAVMICGNRAVATEPENAIACLQHRTAIGGRALSRHWPAGPFSAVKLVHPARRTRASHPHQAVLEQENARMGHEAQPVRFKGPIAIGPLRQAGRSGNRLVPLETENLACLRPQPDPARPVLMDFAEIETIGQPLRATSLGQNIVWQHFHPDRRVGGVSIYKRSAFPAGVEGPVAPPVAQNTPTGRGPKRAIASNRQAFDDGAGFRDTRPWLLQEPDGVPILAREPANSPGAAPVYVAAGTVV